MDYTITGSNQTVYTDKLGLAKFSTVYSEGTSNTIYLSESIAIAPSLGTNYVYGIDKYNLLQYFKSPGPIFVDAIKGHVKNGWGGTDYFQGISGFQGSGYSDFFQGSTKDEVFYTNGGADTVIGGGGWDKVTFYSQPSTEFLIQYDDATGTYSVTETKYPQNVKIFKDIDQLEFGDRSYFAPVKAEFFRGSAKDEIFYTSSGADTVIGGGGWDKVTFYSQPSTEFLIQYDDATGTYSVTETKYPQNVKIFKDIDQLEFGDRSYFTPIKEGVAVNAKLLGIWQPIETSYYSATYTPNIANSFWGNLRFGPSQKEGMVAIGWAYSGFDNKATAVTPVNTLLIEQSDDGTLSIVNERYLASSTTNGGGSVVIADFNSDGRDDVFLAAHNESPFVSSASTAYLSNGSSKFDVVQIPDLVMAHDAQLYFGVDGKPNVIIQSFGATNNLYRYSEKGFEVVSQSLFKQRVGGMSVAIGNLDDLPGLEMVSGDVKVRGGPFGDDKFYIGIYRYGELDIAETLPLKVLTPYMTTRPKYQSIASEWGVGVAHTYRLWIDDFNHDSKPDILAGVSMWKHEPSGPFVYPSMLQMFQNKGSLNFEDVTDNLNKEFPSNSAEIDYNLQIRDIDQSGINSYLSSGLTYEGDERQQNFILLNDGTGRLYEYRREEFVSYLKDVQDFARSKSYKPLWGEFHAYLDPLGKISFAVELALGGTLRSDRLIVQLPLALDPTLDFKQHIKILDRNDSSLIRTWAGDDVISDTNSSTEPVTRINAGLGIDVAKYTQLAKDYVLRFEEAGTLAVRLGASSRSDQLINVERLQFSDKTVPIETKPHGSYADLPDTLYQFFVVGFGAAPGVTYMDQMADAYRYWLPEYKENTVKQIVEAFTTKTQFTSVYPQALYRTEGGKYYAYAHDASLAGNPLVKGHEVTKAAFDAQMASLAKGLVETIVKTSASEATKTAAANDVQAALGLGGDWTIGKVIYTVFGNLATKPVTDPVWGGTAKQFANQVAVAKYYTDTLSQSTDDVATLRSVMAAVTNTTDVSSNDAIASLIGVALLNGPGI